MRQSDRQTDSWTDGQVDGSLNAFYTFSDRATVNTPVYDNMLIVDVILVLQYSAS